MSEKINKSVSSDNKKKKPLDMQLKKYLLPQLEPFPEYPLLHAQTKDPSVLVQLALTSHGLDKHSLMSSKRKRKINKKLFVKSRKLKTKHVKRFTNRNSRSHSQNTHYDTHS